MGVLVHLVVTVPHLVGLDPWIGLEPVCVQSNWSSTLFGATCMACLLLTYFHPFRHFSGLQLLFRACLGLFLLIFMPFWSDEPFPGHFSLFAGCCSPNYGHFSSFSGHFDPFLDILVLCCPLWPVCCHSGSWLRRPFSGHPSPIPGHSSCCLVVLAIWLLSVHAVPSPV